MVSTPPTFPNGAGYSWGNMIPGYENVDPSILIQDSTDQSQATADQEAQLNRDRQAIVDSLLTDPDCLGFLNHNGGSALMTVKSIPINVQPLSNNRAFVMTTEAENRFPNLVPGNPSIIVNNVQPNFFFNTGAKSRPLGTDVVLQSGTERYQITALLHELGHATGALQDDAASAEIEKRNNQLIQKDCAKTINRF
jgi:hypothetical protein